MEKNTMLKLYASLHYHKTLNVTHFVIVQYVCCIRLQVIVCDILSTLRNKRVKVRLESFFAKVFRVYQVPACATYVQRYIRVKSLPFLQKYSMYLRK